MYEIIEKLEREHQKISAFLEEFQGSLLEFMEHDIFELRKFEDAISFIRNFADKEHHQREEKILFRYMTEHLGEMGEKLVRNGMLVEHDFARLFVRELEEAVYRYEKRRDILDKLDILANGQSYCHLLRRHIDKENNVVYPFAVRSLKQEHFEAMQKEDAKEGEIFSDNPMFSKDTVSCEDAAFFDAAE